MEAEILIEISPKVNSVLVGGIRKKICMYPIVPGDRFRKEGSRALGISKALLGYYSP